MTYAEMKRRAKAAIAAFVAGKGEVVVAEVAAEAEAASGIDYAATTIAKFLKAEGFERSADSRGSRYRRADFRGIVCVFCGQPDEPDLHDNRRCPGA